MVYINFPLFLILCLLNRTLSVVCNSGQYQSGNSCFPCSPGTFSTGSVTKCTPCSMGYYSRYSGSAVCTPCQSGTYSSSSGSMTCSSCNAGYYSGSASSSCRQCSEGTYSSYGASTCTSCSAGTYSSSSGSSVCKNCDAGSYSRSGATSCSLCQPGTYSTGGSVSCSYCPSGYYSAYSGSIRCDACEGGTYSAYGGSNSCTTCRAGTYSNKGASSCSQCPTGSYSPESSSRCIYCPPGTYTDKAGSSTCYDCKVGSYSQEGFSVCRNCTSNSCQTCSSTTGDCTGCNPGFSYDATNYKCTVCPASYYSIGGKSKCSKCQTNYYSIIGSSVCLMCPSTCETCDQTNGNCLTCLNGFTLKDGKCDTCEAGTYSYNGICLSCPDLTYSVMGSIECAICDSSCKSCDKTNGYCTSCESGMGISDKKCANCPAGSFSNSSFLCEECPIGAYSSTQKSSTCISCSDGTYSNIKGSQKCQKCNLLCRSACDKLTGYCTNCIDGTVLSNGICIECKAGTKSNQTTNVCETCPSGTYSLDRSTDCKSCEEMKYSLSGASSCSSCDSKCDGCTVTTGDCINCISGYGLSSGKCTICPVGTYYLDSSCKSCEAMKYQNTEGQTTCTNCDISCKSCDAKSGYCLTCFAGYGFNSGICTQCNDLTYSIGGTSKCLDCSDECKSCDPINGACTSCEPGNKKVGESCISCSSTGNCNSCTNETSDGVCTLCKEGTFLDENHNCLPCSDIHLKCSTCSKMSKECFSCSDNLITNGEMCISCEEGKVKSTETTCVYSYEAISRCQIADYINNEQICLKCFAPYCVSENKKMCNLAYTNTTYYNNELFNTSINMNGCINQIGELCYLCKWAYVLIENKCHNYSIPCMKYSHNGCDKCLFDIITTTGVCTNAKDCKYTYNNKNETTCLYCDDDILCGESKENCVVSNNKYCYKSVNNFYSTLSGDIKDCVNSICVFSNSILTNLKCSADYILSNNICVPDVECLNITGSTCIHCSKNHHITDGICTLNDINCVTQNGNICITCENSININGKCVDISTLQCSNFDKICIECKFGYYKDVDGCKEKSLIYLNCEIVSSLNSKCLECETGFILNNNSCVKQEESNQTELNFSYPNLLTKSISKSEEPTYSNYCEEITSKGCIRCMTGYYLSNGNCKVCEYPCVFCSNQTYCTKCDSYSYADNKGVCTEINVLVSVCEVLMSTYRGCVVCKDGFMRNIDGTSCIPCDVSCKTCTNDGNCILCNDSYYRTSSTSSKYCSPQSELIGCINKTTEGCTQCETGYYLSSNLCLNCESNCTHCEGKNECISCIDTNVLITGNCFHYSYIDNCVKSLDSKCSKCNDQFKLSEDKLSCIDSTNYGVIIGIPITVVIIMKNVCVFKINRSNISMSVLENNILTNKQSLTFTDISDTLPVGSESRELLCLGNKGKGILKIQMTTRGGCDKYSIRTEPQLVTLKKGEACEFEVFLTPFCTMKLHDEIMIVAMDIEKGEMSSVPISITLTTENSTRLDYDELIENIKLGEGSFGIVFKGTYRGNTVAIKKMKQATLDKEEKAKQEFENEVSMLDKFRSDHIVHFYGAVFIPNKICMVTEFAQFGSIADLMKKKRSELPRMKTRTKFISECAKGILYLHSNGILHRDIKPDNILVFSLDLNEKVNAKLTDFGSSRNINLLMTNMTFTKGIGTPVYMAPEVLQKEKYTKAADIYSLAITMYEVFSWKEAYNKTEFKFPWKIAEFVIGKNRLKIAEPIQEDQFLLIEKCWCHNHKSRPNAESVVQQLENIM
ncbi:protein serine/threonine kinase, putative [Entamoeba invadens IP1]|uniref:Protein serine/threonine kinase, putative n=1 Tax=Entamoeba invadens IP1 TaxID=370355 RepID=L7FMS3_ENTIV|nr:protein serine/threonine kinase, putative [Entamoeba invadens IP1]ELP91786.1 protein serine/threonine kinase, putative [Entamoeba invadens IP1]|eukprot:XP_004258557.1 protein serine/threonine kinase, putative [Entamoeba invadens IP1]